MGSILLVARHGDVHLDAVRRHLPREVVRTVTDASEFLDLVRRDITRGLSLSLPTLPTDLASVEGGAWDELRAGILSDPRIPWLSRLSDMHAAANRIIQLVVAAGLDIDVPQWVIPRDLDDLRAHLGDGPYVVKPLGPGMVRNPDGEPRMLLSTPMTMDELAGESLVAAPVLAQELVTVDNHVRVVTVGDRTFCAWLPAEGVPVDWRVLDDPVWTPIEPPPALAAQATTLAAHFRLGHTSQDWMQSADGRLVFVRLHPQADWQFLPPELRTAIGAALADALRSVP